MLTSVTHIAGIWPGHEHNNRAYAPFLEIGVLILLSVIQIMSIMLFCLLCLFSFFVDRRLESCDLFYLLSCFW